MNQLYFNRNRVNTFNDAVFSIAITLLVLQINVPGSREIQQKGFLQTLSYMIPNFIGFFVSFIVIAIYWVGHMKFSRYIEKYSVSLLWLNIFLLFFVALLPFSTAFYVNSFNLRGPFVFYCLNIIAVGLFNFILIVKVVKQNAEKLSIWEARWLKFRSLNAISFWSASLVLAFLLPVLSRFFFIFIFVVQAIADRYYKKKEALSNT